MPPYCNSFCQQPQVFSYNDTGGYRAENLKAFRNTESLQILQAFVHSFSAHCKLNWFRSEDEDVKNLILVRLFLWIWTDFFKSWPTWVHRQTWLSSSWLRVGPKYTCPLPGKVSTGCFNCFNIINYCIKIRHDLKPVAVLCCFFPFTHTLT